MYKQQNHISKRKNIISKKNKKHAKHTITYLCGVMEHKNVLAETGSTSKVHSIRT